MAKLDKYEQEILTLFEAGKLKAAKDADRKIKIAKEAAANHLKKEERINIRLTKLDLFNLKEIAAAEGLPYQTLISSVLHKYAKNALKNLEKNKSD
jgi:predicted DNA binding CopG/RHH family protein